MRSIRFLHNSDSGFTLPELLVASLIGLMVTASLLSSTSEHRHVLKKDIVRTRINQNLRGSIDLIGADIRVGGENLNSSFPAIELTNGASGATDSLKVRRSVVAEVFNVCTGITTADTSRRIYVANSTGTAGCDISSSLHAFSVWSTHRVAKGGSTRAFIYNSSTKTGEFFRYTGETNTGTQLYLSRDALNWAANYPAGTSAVYLLEEWEYKVSNDKVLQLVEERETTDTKSMAFDIDNFQSTIYMQDGTSKTSFGTADSWINIKSIEVTLTGEESFNNADIEKTLSGRFFPRNVFSN